MKKIKLREATNKQIKNVVLNHPEQFGFDIPTTRDEMIEAAMDDINWKTGYGENQSMYPDDQLSFRDYVESFIDDCDIYVNIGFTEFNEKYEEYFVPIECWITDFSKKWSGDFSLEMEIEVEE